MKSSHGFTLIELFIVVAIIGIIAAIAVPEYQKWRTGTDIQPSCTQEYQR